MEYSCWRHHMETFSALLAFCAHKGQWRGALVFSLICVWINGWVNNREAGELRRYRAHYDVTVMCWGYQSLPPPMQSSLYISFEHDDVIKWKHFPRYWPFVRGIHRPPVNSPHKGQWRGALVFSLIYAWLDGWVNNDEAGDLRRHRAHYGVTVVRLWAPADAIHECSIFIWVKAAWGVPLQTKTFSVWPSNLQISGRILKKTDFFLSFRFCRQKIMSFRNFDHLRKSMIPYLRIKQMMKINDSVNLLKGCP